MNKGNLLEKAVLALNMYLNAGDKDARKVASIEAKKVWEEYVGKPYFNKNEKEEVLNTLWKETMEIRYLAKSIPMGDGITNHHTVLQQKWVVADSTVFEWRDVPVVEEKIEIIGNIHSQKSNN